MKKYVFPVIFGLYLLCPISVESKQLYVKMNFGLLIGGNVNDSWHLNQKYYDYALTQGKKIGPGQDLSLEFIFQLHPNISFSLGSGYISRSLSGSAGRFTPLGIDEVVENFSCSPKISSEMIPIYLTAILSFPVNPSVQLNFLGGIAYYLGNIKGTEIVGEYGERDNPSMIANRLIWKFESSAKTIGFHAGTGIDMALPLNMFFCFEALYRVVSFKKFKTSVQKMTASGVPEVLAHLIGETGEYLGVGSTFFYVQKIREVEEQKDIDYRVSHFNYSGFSFRAGLKFKF